MQRTKSKLLSILLSLVMLLSLLPTTALAAGTYPDAGAVIVDGGTYFATGYHYFRNGETTSSNNPNNYNAYYNPTTGTLTLQDYNGGSIIAGGTTTADITIKLVGNNTVTGSVISDMGGDITITSDSSGTLTITNTLNDSNAAIGIQAGYGPQTTGNVTITGSADVKIEVTHNGTNGHEDAYGIFAKGNITISGEASVDIICKTPYNTFSNIYCNGLRAVKNVTIETEGEIKIDVTNAGNSDTQSFGIYPTGNAVLTKVGKMEVKWKKHATHSGYPGGAIFGGGSFSDTDHAINVDTTNCYASYRKGTPRKVTVQDGQLTGPGVKYANDRGYFLAGDKVNITPATKKGRSGEEIPFKEWTFSDVMLDKSATTASNSFTVPGKDVTVTATHSPFVGTPTFTPTGTTGNEGTLTFKTVVKADETYEGFRLVKEAEVDDTTKYKSINPSTTSPSSPYEYSYKTNRVSGVNQVEEGNYYVVAYLNNDYYLSDPFTVDYTAAPTPTAAVDDVTITGTTGTVIANKDVVITLTNDTFESTLSGNWITNLPTGLSQSVSRTDDTHAKITVSGNPSVASSAELVIKIPAANLVTSTSDLDVASNANAKYNITAPTNSVNIVAGANMNTTGTANQTGLTGAMTDVVYTADTGYYFPTSYSSIGTSDGVTVTRDSYTQITVSGTPTGDVNITLADATAKAKEDTPTATFAAESENGGKLSSVDNTMKYSVDGGGTWVDITGNDMPITSVTTAKGVQVKKPATDPNTKLDSDVQTIAVTKAATPSTVTAVDCSTSSNNDGKLQNVTTAMEYQKSGAAWTACGGTEVSNLIPGTYYVRVKATGTTLASDSHSVTINAYGTTPAAEPNASFTATGRDAGTLVISGTYTSTMKYSVDGGIGWNDVTSANMPITGVTAAKGIQVKDAGNGSTTSESTVKSITVTEGAKPTGLTVIQPSTIGGTGKIETDTSHEYNTDGSATFTPCTGALDNLNAGAYHVRVKANGTMLASETETYTITAFTATPETTPSATFTATGPDSGTLSGLVSGGSYTVTGAAPATFTASGTTQVLNSVSVGALSIVKKGNGTTTTDSAAKIITVTKAETPSTVTAVGCTTSSNNNGKLQHVTTAMEYQKSGATAWTPGTGSDIIDLPAGTYLVRVKANGTELASDSQSVVVAAYVAPTEYTITFDVNGGSGTIASQTTSGKKLSSLPTATHSGSYSFAGWYTTASGGTQITTAYTFSADTTVYAHWTYIGGGGGGGSSSGGSAATPSVSDKAAKELKNAKEGSTVTIDMKGETKLPASVTKEIAGKDVTVELDMGGGMVWSFNGLDVPKGGVRLDLGVKTGTKTIPAKVINALTGEATTIQLQLNHNGPFGMSLNLSVDLGKKHNGMYANLYFYNSKSGELEFQSAGMISGGKASWAFDHASDYAIVIDKESHEPMTFNDVPASAYYAEAVNWAVAKKITEGVGNGLFAPNQPCTRAQIVTFLWRAAGSPAPKNMSSFADVPADAFYAKAVAWAVENGITGGTGDGKFSPDATCTRAQAVTFLYRASGAPAVSGNAAFSDVATNAYYAAAVKWAEKNGITGGIGGGLFGSGNDCTRSQIVTFLYRNYQSK